MTWFVQPCKLYAKSTDCQAFRVQRWVQHGQQGAYEMAFVHSNKDLCIVIAALLNGKWYANAEGVQICTTDTT